MTTTRNTQEKNSFYYTSYDQKWSKSLKKITRDKTVSQVVRLVSANLFTANYTD